MVSFLLYLKGWLLLNDEKMGKKVADRLETLITCVVSIYYLEDYMASVFSHYNV